MPPLGAATLPGMAINVVGSIHNRSFTSVGKMLQFALSSIIVEAVLRHPPVNVCNAALEAGVENDILRSYGCRV